MKIRYCVTHVNLDGLRCLTLPKQARHTFATREAAQEWLDAAREDLRCKILGVMADSLEVKPFTCHDHGDPISTYYCGDDGEPYRLNVGDVVARADILSDSIPAFIAMRGRVVNVSMQDERYTARVHWDGDAEPEFGMRPIWQLRRTAC